VRSFSTRPPAAAAALPLKHNLCLLHADMKSAFTMKMDLPLIQLHPLNLIARFFQLIDKPLQLGRVARFAFDVRN
jgi:hypothetical protein